MIRLGVDLGGTGIKVGLVENGRILKKGSCPTGAADGAEAVIDRIAALCREVAGEKLKTLSSAGIGTPGVLCGRRRGDLSRQPQLCPHAAGRGALTQARLSGPRGE